MVDKVRVLRLLRAIADDLAILRHGVLDLELAGRMQRAVGFRNVLVHEYVRVDDAVVLHRLGDLSDLEAFLRELADWASKQT